MPSGIVESTFAWAALRGSFKTYFLDILQEFTEALFEAERRQKSDQLASGGNECLSSNNLANSHAYISRLA